MLQQLLPKDKFDLGAVEKLKDYSFSDIKPIIPELLIWVQDMNWPIAQPIADYLALFSFELEKYFTRILQGDDAIWKHSILSILKSSGEKIDSNLLREIQRISSNPTPEEVNEGVQEIATQILA